MVRSRRRASQQLGPETESRYVSYRRRIHFVEAIETVRRQIHENITLAYRNARQIVANYSMQARLMYADHREHVLDNITSLIFDLVHGVTAAEGVQESIVEANPAPLVRNESFFRFFENHHEQIQNWIGKAMDGVVDYGIEGIERFAEHVIGVVAATVHWATDTVANNVTRMLMLHAHEIGEDGRITGGTIIPIIMSH